MKLCYNGRMNRIILVGRTRTPAQAMGGVLAGIMPRHAQKPYQQLNQPPKSPRKSR